MVRIAITITLEILDILMWNPTDVNKWHVKKLDYEINESCKCLKKQTRVEDHL